MMTSSLSSALVELAAALPAIAQAARRLGPAHFGLRLFVTGDGQKSAACL
jgi:hypothetical protein